MESLRKLGLLLVYGEPVEERLRCWRSFCMIFRVTPRWLQRGLITLGSCCFTYVFFPDIDAASVRSAQALPF